MGPVQIRAQRQEDQLRRLTHSFSNRSRVSTFREFRTAEKAAELAPAFNHVAHAPVCLARLDRRGAIKQCRLPRRLASYPLPLAVRSEEHTSELQSLMRISYAVFCLKKKKRIHTKYNRMDMIHV